MAAKDWVENEFPAESDPYPARRRVRQMGWYLKQPRYIQRFICGVWSCMPRRRVYLRASTRGWLMEARGLAVSAAYDAGDAASAYELGAARSEDHIRRRKGPASARDIRAAKRRAYVAHRAERRWDRRELGCLLAELEAEDDADVRSVIGEDIQQARESLRAGFSRHALRFDASGRITRWS
jgi:hypothetical protein